MTKSDECKIQGNVKETDSGVKFNIKIKGKGCAKLTNEEIMKKIKEGDY